MPLISATSMCVYIVQTFLSSLVIKTLNSKTEFSSKLNWFDRNWIMPFLFYWFCLFISSFINLFVLHKDSWICWLSSAVQSGCSTHPKMWWLKVRISVVVVVVVVRLSSLLLSFDSMLLLLSSVYLHCCFRFILCCCCFKFFVVVAVAILFYAVVV